jgi:long-chain acyl-CoA synthetase
MLREIVDASERRPDSAKVSPIEHPEEVLTEAERHWMTPVGTLMHTLSVLLFVLNRALARFFFRVEVEGLEHLPEGQPCVLAPNHTSYLDPFAVAAVLSYSRLRQTYWAGSVYVLFTSSFKRAFSRVAQVLPVAGDPTGRASLAFAALTFKRNKNLVWFPEGSRSESGELLPFKHGLGLVLEKYPVLVVPVYIHGAYEAWPMHRRFPRPGKIKVVFGPPCEVQTLQQQGQGEHDPARIVSALREQVAELGTQTELVQQD